MPDKAERKPFPGNKILVLILTVLFINTLLIGLGYYLVIERIYRADSLLIYKQELARDISEYSYRLAIDLGVHDLPEVREALAEYNYALDLSVGSDELIQVVLNQGRRMQDVIYESADTRLKERVLNAVNSDHRVNQSEDKVHLFIRITDGQITILPDQLLEARTIQRINTIFTAGSYQGNQNIDIEIEKGKAQLVVPQTAEDQIRALTEDLNSVRIRLHEIRVQAGLAEMVGPGITLYIYDADEIQGSGSIVHDADIRDIVNELFSAGARGISIGGERLMTTSPIRCTGPLIMVNYRQVASNPVVIEAIGDPDLLISGLGIIANELEARRGLSFEVNHSGFIKLPAYLRVE
ncbi:MAG: DUF881 domain-containing protein [Bacillota bacterium]|nr:DUF881 domain-containing protein [Bacillota bacterium]MDW7729170.1 DUF881 domain-containing protein [Bacillota bacterium]